MPHIGTGEVPKLLSEVGAFDDLKSLRPAQGIVPYDVNVPFWSDGAEKQRWIAVPAGGQIRFSRRGAWSFSPGTVFIKHFQMPARRGEDAGRRLETRILVCDSEGGVYGASYRWRSDSSDADLVTEPIIEKIIAQGDAGPIEQSYYFPGRADCVMCHTRVSGGVLGVTSRQLNRPERNSGENQLLLWQRLGLFDSGGDSIAPQNLATLAPSDDKTRSLVDRARSFLDANCSNCHQPGGAPGNFDARYETPLRQQNLLGGPVLIDLGIDQARVIAPHDPWRSMAVIRVETPDRTKMPPLGHEMVNQVGAGILRAWIDSLPGPDVLEPPTISPKGGEFSHKARVVLSDIVAGAVIHYTLDGSAPLKSSPIYEKPLDLTEPVTLRARAYKEGMTRSIIVQETFVVNQ